MKVGLVFPPYWTAEHPFSLLGWLTGHLREAGHQIEILDLNLEFHEHALSPASVELTWRSLELELEYARDEIKYRVAANARHDDFGYLCEKAKRIEEHLKQGRDWLDPEIERWIRAGQTMRDPERFYDPTTLIHTKRDILRALDFFLLPFFPYGFDKYRHKVVPLSLKPMIGFCGDSLANPFFTFLQNRVPRIMGRGFDLLVIIIGSSFQALPGLTLARLLKHGPRDPAPGQLHRGRSEERARPHINLAGPFFPRVKPVLKERPTFFEEFCDSLTLGEPQVPTAGLATAIESHGDNPNTWRSVPSLLFLTDGGVHETPEGPYRPMDDRPLADLSEVPLERYYAPETVLPIKASSSCYYGKCAFCDSFHGLKADAMSVDRIVTEINHLNREFGIRHFEFIDQCIEPSYMEKMCDGIIASNLDIRWFCNGRTETGFTRGVLEKMKRAGCTKVMWGIESGSARLLKLMKKGISPETRLQVLETAAEVGLWNFAFIFFGFPTETEEEAMSTIDLLWQHRNIIHSYGRSVFTLGKNSPLIRDFGDYGILDWIEDDQEFSNDLSFKLSSGLQGAAVSAIGDRCLKIARQAYGDDPLWMGLQNRETVHLYLAKHGRPYVESYRLGDPTGMVWNIEFAF